MPQSSPAINSAHSGDFLRLKRIFQRQTHFSLIFAAVDNPAYRDDLIQLLMQDDRTVEKSATLAKSTVAHLLLNDSPLQVLHHCEIAQENSANRLHLCLDIDNAMTQDWWQQVNVLRERIADAFPHTLIFWLSDAQITTAARYAPDVWNWRSAVFSFVSQLSEEDLQPQLTSPTFNAITHTEAKSAQIRLQEIKDYLRQKNGLSTSYLLLEAADIEEGIGDLTSALNHAQLAADLFEENNNAHLLAVTKGKIANIFKARGKLDEALAIQQDEVLPIFKHLGDVRSAAITQGRIADIFQIRGRLNEALEIRQEILPILEKLGDVRSVAVCKGQIADIYQTLGKLDEALTIRQNDELPVYEQLGDVRGAAVTKGKIADIFQARGRLDEALAIRQNDILPIFEKLGDVRSAAIIKGRIADIFRARGRLEEALAIRLNEELPAFEQLGDVRSAAITKGKIADIFQTLGRLEEALAIWQNDVLPIFVAMGCTNEAETVRDRVQKLLAQKTASAPTTSPKAA